MKLTIKTLNQQTFEVDFDDSKTVLELKKHLSEIGVGVSPDRQQLIYAGRMLADGEPLKLYSIDERKYLVVMASKQEENTAKSVGKVTVKSTKKESKAKAATKLIYDRPGPSTRSQTRLREKAKQLAIAKTATSPSDTATNNMPVVDSAPGEVDPATLAIIIGMGYPEAEARNALLASFNNPDRAVEYLVEGTPELPIDIPFPTFGGQVGEGNTSNSLDFIRNDPRFAQMRDIVQQRPELLGMVMNKIGESNPGLIGVIREHEEEFLSLLNENNNNPEPVTTSALPRVGQTALSDSERASVARLSAMGFPQDMALQAYIACNKNEEQAADFLLRHMDDEN